MSKMQEAKEKMMNVESKTKDKPKLFPLPYGERGGEVLLSSLFVSFSS